MPRRRIKKADIKFVSLCKRGKNRQSVVYKSDDGMVEFDALTKEGPDFDEKGQIMTLVYPAGYDDVDGDSADPEVVTEMAHSFMRNGAKIDVRHNGKALKPEQAYVAESFIVQDGDPRFTDWKDKDGNPVDATGGWGAVFQVDDPILRANYREGEWDGVSLFGPATVEEVKAASDDVLEDAVRAMRALLSPGSTETSDGEIDMKPDELAKALEEPLKGLGKEILQGVAAIVNPPKPDDDQVAEATRIAKAAGFTLVKSGEKGFPSAKPLAFTGSITSRRDLIEHAKKLELAKASEGIDMSDPEAVLKLAATLEKDDSGGEIPKLEGLSAEQRCEIYAQQLRKERGGSNALFSPRDGDDFISLEKDGGDPSEIGKEMADFMNGRWNQQVESMNGTVPARV